MQYTARAVAHREVEVSRCPVCRESWRAEVSVEATGEGNSLFYLDNDGARVRAARAAAAAVEALANESVAVAKCPRCGGRDWLAVALAGLRGSLRAGNTLLVAAMVFLFAGVGPAYIKSDAMWALVAFVSFGGVIAGVFAVQSALALYRSHRGVRVVDSV